MEQLRNDVHYTYADYYSWDDDQRRELIDGAVYVMSPSPTAGHQIISGNLFRILANYIFGKPYRIFAAPFDVRLNSDTLDDTVVQPDLTIIRDRSKLDEAGCAGIPDFVVEILSPSTASHDKLRKLRLYEKSGIQEYWIIDPYARTMHAYILENGRYNVNYYTSAETVNVSVLEDCTVNLPEVFED